MIWIRPANGTDIDWLLEQLRAFSAFYGTKAPLFPDDDNAASRIVNELVRNQPFFVAVQLGERVGFISGALMPHPYNPAIRVLQELFWWVSPEWRRSRAGALLLNHFVEFGREHADWILMTIEAKSPVNPSTLEKRGFRAHERTFLLEVA